MRTGVVVLALLLSACQQNEPKLQVLIGATVVKLGAPPVPDAIVVIDGGRIRSAGARRDVPVPQDSERTDLTGKFIVPTGVNAIASGQPASLEIRDGSPSGPVVRRMSSGQWQP